MHARGATGARRRGSVARWDNTRESQTRRRPTHQGQEATVAPSHRAHPPTDYSRPPAGPASIPLTPEDATATDGSLGSLVKDASVHFSTLVRSEIELAKLEVAASVKQALRGSIFFAAAAAIGLFSLWFFWLMVGEIIDIWLPRWAAFAIVFGAMLVMAGLLALLGLRRVKKIGKPQQTISEAQQTASALKTAAGRSEAAGKNHESVRKAHEAA
jgi:uncharacterized membrane protein YqjE